MILKRRLFFANLCLVGGGFATVEAMLFIALRKLDASPLLCGLSVLVTVVFELPIFWNSEWFLEKWGAKKMICVGQLAWVVRALFYAWMPRADYVLFVEPLHGVTFALVWTAAIHETAKMAPDGRGFICIFEFFDCCGDYIKHRAVPYKYNSKYLTDSDIFYIPTPPRHEILRPSCFRVYIPRCRPRFRSLPRRLSLRPCWLPSCLLWVRSRSFWNVMLVLGR